MQDLPHHYRVAAAARPEGSVDVSSPGLATLESASPAAYGGPGDKWSPETFLVAAVADCFVLTFKAIARASKFEWRSLACDVEGVLDMDDGVTRFVSFRIEADLEVPAGADEARAKRLLQKAEEKCLIARSLAAAPSLTARVKEADQNLSQKASRCRPALQRASRACRNVFPGRVVVGAIAQLRRSWRARDLPPARIGSPRNRLAGETYCPAARRRNTLSTSGGARYSPAFAGSRYR